ncbi:MAG: hypothetical protein ICV69_05540 [Thermoleophilaceae bacterium]|nr:hypothetical protein [Thermoleophilaceae bacterium]
MGDAVHHVLLALAVLALGHAALRLASRIAPSGLERAVVAIVFGVAAAVLEALALGLLGLGANAVALSAAAALTWIAALALLPTPRTSVVGEVSVWWRRLGPPWRLAAGALIGSFAAWVIWQLGNPSIGFDGSVYHYAEVAGWIANGRPGSILALSYDLPYGNYPLTDEVALTWAAGIARSWVPLSLWNPVMLVVLMLASWLTLRNLAVPARAAALATTALVTPPVVTRQLNEPQTDLPTLAWVACTAALATGAGRRPALLVPAIVSGGLALGTKTTSAGMVAAALAVGVVLARRRAPPPARWLAVSLVAAFAVGGIWYARNLIDHGSPFWPFASTPWGDPGPAFLNLIDTRFADRPLETLDGRLGDYTARLGGIWLLLLGAVVVLAAAPLVRGRRLRRALIAAGAISVLGMFLWSIAPGTGEQTAPGQLLGSGWPISTVRYILPAAFAAMVAVALAARAPARFGIAATWLLAAAAAWSVVATARVPAPYTPPPWALVVGGTAGALVVAAATVVSRMADRTDARLRDAPMGALAVAAAVAVGAALAPAADGFVARHAQVAGTSALAPRVVGWFAAQPWFREGDRDIAFISRTLLAPLAGDHFTNRLELLPRTTGCARVRRRISRTPVVVTHPGFLRGFLGVRSYTSGRCLSGRGPDFQDPAFRVYAP